jgi:hypothetical protein
MKITEVFPIGVSVEKTWTGRYFAILVPPMKMTFETFRKLGDNLSEDAIRYGKEMDNRVYEKEVELYANDVSISQYDYQNGECRFSASTEKDVKNWLELHKNFVYLI